MWSLWWALPPHMWNFKRPQALSKSDREASGVWESLRAVQMESPMKSPTKRCHKESPIEFNSWNVLSLEMCNFWITQITYYTHLTPTTFGISLNSPFSKCMLFVFFFLLYLFTVGCKYCMFLTSRGNWYSPVEVRLPAPLLRPAPVPSTSCIFMPQASLSGVSLKERRVLLHYCLDLPPPLYLGGGSHFKCSALIMQCVGFHQSQGAFVHQHLKLAGNIKQPRDVRQLLRTLHQIHSTHLWKLLLSRPPCSLRFKGLAKIFQCIPDALCYDNIIHLSHICSEWKYKEHVPLREVCAMDRFNLDGRDTQLLS